MGGFWVHHETAVVVEEINAERPDEEAVKKTLTLSSDQKTASGTRTFVLLKNVLENGKILEKGTPINEKDVPNVGNWVLRGIINT